MGFSDFITLFFLVAAVLIFFQLRSVLGRRTGNEKPPFDPYSPRDVAKGPVADDNKVVTLPKRSEAEDENRFAEADALAPADYYRPRKKRCGPVTANVYNINKYYLIYLYYLY